MRRWCWKKTSPTCRTCKAPIAPRWRGSRSRNWKATSWCSTTAFQHRRLKRDLDLVLIDATCPWGHGYLLPRGLLREPISGLKRADAVILTRCDSATRQAVQRDPADGCERHAGAADRRIDASAGPVAQCVAADGAAGVVARSPDCRLLRAGQSGGVSANAREARAQRHRLADVSRSSRVFEGRRGRRFAPGPGSFPRTRHW